MARPAFTPQVAARTRAAQEIRKDADLLAVYIGKGGLKSDLDTIRDRGLEAEAANLGQSVTGAAGLGATLDVLRGFVDTQREYVTVMAVVKAVRYDVATAGADSDTVKSLDTILRNEAAVVIRTVTKEEGKPARKAVPSQSQEAVRAEIAKDAGALEELKSAHAALAGRGVSLERIAKLRVAAEGLSGKLATRTAKKGARKDVTKAEHAAVTAQRERWGSCYGILAQAGAANSSIQKLLDDAAKA
ncbi:MAG: hypothetical protein HY720_02190 [Planctomycetes bacterium]|nr:hypothetical protein [Planctomycetota bacterium]